jgi:shikimate kinase/3-dehydroquinate synthase
VAGLNALGRHLALIGFMGAGKTTIGPEVARRLGRRFLDVDDEIERAEGPIWQLFAERGEAAFRELEADFLRRACAARDPVVIAVGGGAVETRDLLGTVDAFAVHLEVDLETAWRRVQGSRRPLARDEAEFRRRFELRAPLYAEVADARAQDVDGVVLAAGGVHVATGSLERLGELVPGDEPAALVSDATVAGIHGAEAQLALGARLASTHELPPGEDAKALPVVERLWRELRLDRGGTVVALGGGCVTDVAGFAAATWLRGVAWVPVPTTLVGQVDAAIGGKTAIDLPGGKNLVGAFHWPARTVVDPALLATLPERERRNGLAEVVKTGLLAGEPLWELSVPEQVRRCAAYKAALCLRDPYDTGDRRWLNLGHTFAHGLEAAADYALPHGEAVALGLLAALRLSGRDTRVVEELLDPKPVRVDRDRAWEALRRDKKARGGELRLVLLDDGGPVVRAVSESEVRPALDALIRT